VQRKALNKRLRCDSPATIGKHALTHPPVGRSQINATGTGADHIGRLKRAVSEEPRENPLVGKSIEWSAAEHWPFGPCRKRPKNPPHGSSIRFGFNDWRSELHTGTKCHLFRQGEIGSLELSRCRKHMRREFAEFRIGHIDDDERIEQRRGLAEAVRLRKCRERVSPRYDQNFEESGFDFIDQRSNRQLPRNSHQLGA
jgi:hypothetical protein